MKKILFYGNCQIGAISEIFRLDPVLKQHFEVLDASHYNLPTQDYRSVANFLLTHENHSEHDLQRMLNDADIFIFHSLKPTSNRPDHVLTENLVQNFQGQSICIPSAWYSGYFGHPYKFPMLDIFIWMYQQGLTNEQALNYLTYSDIPNMHNLHQYYHDASLSGLKKRADSDKSLYNYICMEHWLQNTYKHKLVTYNHSHPTGHYFNFIAKELTRVINPSLSHEVTDCFELPIQIAGPNGHFLPTRWNFFNKIFTDLEPIKPRMLEKFNEWGDYKTKNPDLFVNLGMHHATCTPVTEMPQEVIDLLHLKI